MSTESVLAEVARERNEQELQGWSREHDDGHTENDWIGLLVRDMGRAVFSARFRRSMIVVAALAVAAVEWYDRNYGPDAQTDRTRPRP